MSRGEIFHEEIRNPRALSLNITMTAKKKTSFGVEFSLNRLPVLLYRTDEGEYVAKCLTISQIGMGHSAVSAMHSLVRALAIILTDAMENNYLVDLMANAKRELGAIPTDVYWKEFLRAVKARADKKARRQTLTAGVAEGVFRAAQMLQHSTAAC